jgi:hypothetical protein
MFPSGRSPVNNDVELQGGVFMFCTKCGEQVSNVGRFCHKCGAKIVQADTDINQEPVTTEPTEAPPMSEKSGENIDSIKSAPEKKKKSKTIYYLLYVITGIALFGALSGLIIRGLAGGKSNVEAIKSIIFLSAVLLAIRASLIGKSKALWATIGVVVGIASSFAIIATTSYIYGKKHGVERSLAVEAEKINKTLPKNTPDGESTMVSVSTSGKKMTYNFKLITATKIDISKDDIEVHKKRLKEDMCKLPDITKLFEKGVTAEYVYTDKNDELVMTANFDKEICKPK